MITRTDLTETKSKGYEPTASRGLGGWGATRDPFVRDVVVPQMMRDSRVQISLNYLKGTILSQAKFFVKDNDAPEGANSPVKEYLIEQINRWWNTSINNQMTAFEWGFSGHEVIYKWQSNMLHFSHLKSFKHNDVEPVTLDSELKGILVTGKQQNTKKSIYIGMPKCLWHIQGRQFDPYYGRSRLFPAYDAWQEKNSSGGAMDIRRLYFYKYAFTDGVIYHPTGETPLRGGQMQDNGELARNLAEKLKTGGTLTLPDVRDQNGNRRWEKQPMVSGTAGPEVLQYPEQLKRDIAEGIGVPNELIEAAETGSGFSGRRIPLDAFRGMLSDPLFWLISDLDQQVLRSAVRINFSIAEPNYEIIPFGLVRDQQNDVQAVNMQTGEPENDKVKSFEDNVAA